MRATEALDLYIGDLARRGKAKTTRDTYFRLLGDFIEGAGRHREVATYELLDYERFLDRWVDAEPSTLAHGVSLCRGFSRFCYERKLSKTDVAASLKRPKRIPYEDLDVTVVSQADILKMFDAVEDVQELLCLATPLYLGARRRAISAARWGDVDLTKGTIKFRAEKGRKTIIKPLPEEYRQLLIACAEQGVWSSPNDYLVPNRRPGAVKRDERSDKVIWMTIKKIAARAHVCSHVHALRAAMACQFDDQHPGQLMALKELMGHARLETTLVYLRRKQREGVMQLNRDLSFGFGSTMPMGLEPALPSLYGKAHTGFEPVLCEPAVAEPLRAQSEAPELLQKHLERLRGELHERARSTR